MYNYAFIFLIVAFFSQLRLPLSLGHPLFAASLSLFKEGSRCTSYVNDIELQMLIIFNVALETPLD